MSSEGLKRMGFYQAYRPLIRLGCCAVCNCALREMLLICADLYCCDNCGIIYRRRGDGELLYEIGRREVKK